MNEGERAGGREEGRAGEWEGERKGKEGKGRERKKDIT